MPRKSEDTRLKDANRKLRIALEECQSLLKRTEEMLHKSQQDNEPQR